MDSKEKRIRLLDRLAERYLFDAKINKTCRWWEVRNGFKAGFLVAIEIMNKSKFYDPEWNQEIINCENIDKILTEETENDCE